MPPPTHTHRERERDKSIYPHTSPDSPFFSFLTTRYAHTKRYVTESAREAGYDLISYREMTPRWEGAEPVPGHLFVFSRDA